MTSRSGRGSATLPSRDRLVVFLSLLLGVWTLSGPAASAQGTPAHPAEAPPGSSSSNEIEQPGEPAVDDDVNEAVATPDPSPRVPVPFEERPSETEIDVVEQAGVGGPVAYAEAGVLEVGGAGGLLIADDVVVARLAPFMGLFVFDGLQLTLINEIFVSGGRGTDVRVSVFALGEPSLHVRLNDRTLVMFGVAAGLLFNGDDFGVAIRPRVGVDVLIGRSGLLRPAFVMTWGSKDLVELGGALLEDERLTFGLELAYSALF